jgi:hypothetical protein
LIGDGIDRVIRRPDKLRPAPVSVLPLESVVEVLPSEVEVKAEKQLARNRIQQGIFYGQDPEAGEGSFNPRYVKSK